MPNTLSSTSSHAKKSSCLNVLNNIDHSFRHVGWAVKLAIGFKSSVCDQVLFPIIAALYGPSKNDPSGAIGCHTTKYECVQDWTMRALMLMLLASAVARFFYFRYKQKNSRQKQNPNHTDGYVEMLEQYYGLVTFTFSNSTTAAPSLFALTSTLLIPLTWLVSKFTAGDQYTDVLYPIATNLFILLLLWLANFDPDLGFKNTFTHQVPSVSGRSGLINKKPTLRHYASRTLAAIMPAATSYMILDQLLAFIDANSTSGLKTIATWVAITTAVRSCAEIYFTSKQSIYKLDRIKCKMPNVAFQLSRVQAAANAGFINFTQTLFIIGYSIYLCWRLFEKNPGVQIVSPNDYIGGKAGFYSIYSFSGIIGLIALQDVIRNYKGTINFSLQDGLSLFGVAEDEAQYRPEPLDIEKAVTKTPQSTCQRLPKEGCTTLVNYYKPLAV